MATKCSVRIRIHNSDLQIGGSESEAFSLPVVLKINVVKLIGRRWGFTALPLVIFFPAGKRNKSVKGEVYRYWLGWKDGWPIRCS
jgi:hypothetical protein